MGTMTGYVLDKFVLTDDLQLTTKDGKSVKLSDHAIKNIIKLTVPELSHDNIEILETKHKRYYYFTSYNSINIYDDIYTDGFITETSSGKIISDFNIIIGITKNKDVVNTVKIILHGEKDEDLFKLHSEKLLKYLNPSVFSLLI